MLRLSSVGQDKSIAVLLLLTCLGIGQPALAAAPVAVDDVVATNEDTPVAITLMATDADGDSLTYTVGLPGNGVVSGAPPNVTYTPGSNFNGSDSFTFMATGGGEDSNLATITINVAPVNDPPTANAQSVSGAEDGSIVITLTGTDPDGDMLTFANGAPSNGSLSGTAPNLTYTPNLNFNGSDSFTFTVDDGSGSVASTVSIMVTPVNDAPSVAAIPAPVTAVEDAGAVIVNLAGVFADADGDPLTLSVTGTSNPTLFTGAPSIGGGTLTMNLAPNQNGSSTVTLQAQDPSGATVTADVSITVTPVNDAPTVTTPIPDMNPPEDSAPIVLTLGSYFGDVDVATNGDTLTYTVTGNDNSAIVTTAIAGANLTLTFVPNMNGVANLTVQAQDAGGLTVSDTFKVTVDSVNDTPVAADDSAVMNEDAGSIDINVLANDTHGDDPTTIVSAGQTWTLAGVDYPDSSETAPTTVIDPTGTSVTLPNGSLVINGNVITYTPKPNFNGTDHFTYTIQDADGETATATVTVTINAVNDAPTETSSASYTVQQASVLTIVAAGGIASHGFDADGDPVTVIQDTAPASLGMGFAGTTLESSAGRVVHVYAGRSVRRYGYVCHSFL